MDKECRPLILLKLNTHTHKNKLECIYFKYIAYVQIDKTYRHIFGEYFTDTNMDILSSKGVWSDMKGNVCFYYICVRTSCVQ